MKLDKRYFGTRSDKLRAMVEKEQGPPELLAPHWEPAQCAFCPEPANFHFTTKNHSVPVCSDACYGQALREVGIQRVRAGDG